MSDQIYALDLDQELLFHLAEPQAWDFIIGEDITDEIINDDLVAEIFNWQKQYLRKYKKVAPVPVLEDEFDGVLIEEPQTVIEDIVERLRTRYAKNQQREKINEIIKKQSSDPSSVPDLLVKTGQDLKTVLHKRGEIYGTGDFDRTMNYYYKQTLRGPGASYGFKELDDYMVGAKGLSAVLGPPKSMKSWIGIQIALANVVQGTNTWHYSLELPSVESDMRLRCLAANIPFWKYIHNKFSEEDSAKLAEASEIIDGLGTYKFCKPDVGKRTIDEIVYTAGDAGAKVIIIDQLQYVETGNGMNLGSHNNTGVYWNVLNKARDYSDDIPIIYMHQLHRMHPDERPTMADAKGSSAIEETATVAFSLWSDKEMKRNKKREIEMLAARNHELASWEIAFDMKHGCNFEITGRSDLDDEVSQG